MNTNNGLSLVVPRIVPVLDPDFRPAVLANRAFIREVRVSGKAFPLTLALEQTDGSTFHFSTEIFAEDHPKAVANFVYVERIVKFLLWAWGGYRVYLNGPKSLGDKLKAHFTETATGKFDADIMGNRIYERPFEVVV